MTEENSEFLEKTCGLTPKMVAPFAHQLRSTQEGRLIAPHHRNGEGEEYDLQADGLILRRFTGGSEDKLWDRGHGPSVWSADPEPAAPIRFVLIAASMLVAIAAAAKLDPATRACTRIVSTAGDLSKAGRLKLTRLIREAQQECVRAGGGKLGLVDASNLGEQGTTLREDTLYQLAASTGARYERWAPEGYKDWSQVVIADRRAQEAAEAQAAMLADPVNDQDPPQPDRGRSLGGRSR